MTLSRVYESQLLGPTEDRMAILNSEDNPGAHVAVHLCLTEEGLRVDVRAV